MAVAETTINRPLSQLEKRLLDEYQDGLPLSPRPYAVMAERLGHREGEVIDTLQRLQQAGLISRVGPVFRPNRVGASTLAAMTVSEQRLEEVAALVSACPEVNHNYEREHALNLWFVATASDKDHLERVIAEIESRTGIPVIRLPMLEDYYINLGFPLQWG